MSKKRIIFSIVLVLFAFVTAFSTTACGNRTKTPTKPVADNRPMAYVAKSGEDNSVLKEFASLYTAIDYIVENCDFGDYVTKKSGDDNDVKMFVYREKYSTTTQDMLYYYENGTSLDTYTSWSENYFSEMQEARATTLFLSGQGQGLRPYIHGQELVGKTTNTGNGIAYNYAKNSPAWNLQKFVDSQVIVNPPTYSGVTKVEYDVNLKEAELYPSRNMEQDVAATVGFTVADAYYVVHFGLYCDLLTGNWYYYSGEFDLEADANSGAERDIEKEVLMTSTWNAEKECWIPNENITLTTESVRVPSGTMFIVEKKMTAKFIDSNRTITRTVEHPSFTHCGTLRFSASLDILNEFQPDYMNGAQFLNLVITRADSYSYAENFDPIIYGNVNLLQVEGKFNNLNSLPQTVMRNLTILYNPGIITYDFETAGRDVYNFSYKLDTNTPAYSTPLRNMISKLEAVPTPENLQPGDRDLYVLPARAAYNALSAIRIETYQNQEYLAALLANLELAETYAT